jgi:hypothetical protein
MPESRQLYADVEEGKVSQATPPVTVTSSTTGRMQFSIQFAAPRGIPIQPQVEEPPQGT